MVSLLHSIEVDFSDGNEFHAFKHPTNIFNNNSKHLPATKWVFVCFFSSWEKSFPLQMNQLTVYNNNDDVQYTKHERSKHTLYLEYAVAFCNA